MMQLTEMQEGPRSVSQMAFDSRFIPSNLRGSGSAGILTLKLWHFGLVPVVQLLVIPYPPLGSRVPCLKHHLRPVRRGWGTRERPSLSHREFPCLQQGGWRGEVLSHGVPGAWANPSVRWSWLLHVPVKCDLMHNSVCSPEMAVLTAGNTLGCRFA